MSDSKPANASLKYTTITAIVLLVLIAVPYVVVEIARSKAERAAKKYTTGVKFQLSGIEFDSKEFFTLTFQPTPDSAPNVYSAVWSLSQWKVISTDGVYPSHPIDVDISSFGGEGFLKGSSFGGDGTTSIPPVNWKFDATKWETGQSESADVPPLKADRINIDPGRP